MALPLTGETGQNTEMDGITIRPARPADARSIARLDVETWRTTYAGVLSADYLVGLSVPRREFGWRMAILREPRDIRVAVDLDGVVQGFGSCGPSRSEQHFSGEVFTLYVAPDLQNQGIGRRLLIALFRRLAGSGLDAAIIWVLRDNPSRFFYERLGGRIVSQKPIPVGGGRVCGIRLWLARSAGLSRGDVERGSRSRELNPSQSIHDFESGGALKNLDRKRREEVKTWLTAASVL